MHVTRPTDPGPQAPGAVHGLVEDLTPAQRRAVETTTPTVCVLAAAGSGKTRVLTRRIAYRVLTGTAAPGHVAAITFTRKAAGELQQRLEALGAGGEVAAGTFHSFAFAQLRRWWADRRTPEPAVLQRKGRLVAELATRRAGLEGAAPADLAGEIEWAKARLVPPEGYAAAATLARRDLPGAPEAVAALYARYEDEKRRRRLVDFDDLLSHYADALGSDARFGAAQRWRWKHVFVDELQDVNPAQCRLLEALVEGNDDLFVVGDPNQAIYGWNGADPSFLARFPERWPAAEVVRLEENHRSSPQVVAAAAAVLGRQGAGPGTSVLRSTRPAGPPPELRSFSSEDAEAHGVAAQLEEARERGLDWDDMAVLARANSQLEVIAAALDRAGIPFRSLALADGAGRADAEVAAGARGSEAEPCGAVARAPARLAPGAPPGLVTLSTFHRAKGLQWHSVWLCGLEAGFVPIAYATGPEAMAEERRLLYVALTRAETELRCSWARQRRATSGAALRREPSPWLPVLAAHCASGEGRLGDDEARPAATRTRASAREGTGDNNLVELFSAARRRLGRSACRQPAAGDEAGPDSAGEAAAERLRQWRARLARASGVPPHVLFHDSTLHALAALRPASTEDLLAVPGLGPVKVARFGPALLEVIHVGEPLARQA